MRQCLVILVILLYMFIFVVFAHLLISMYTFITLLDMYIIPIAFHVDVSTLSRLLFIFAIGCFKIAVIVFIFHCPICALFNYLDPNLCTV